jgi:hypothetical protein
LAPLVALAGAAVFAIQLVVLGLIMNLSIFAAIAALIWPFVLVLGLLMAILLIGALIGWPLMSATVSVEGTDAFDALSRSYAYVYQRPWRLLWYVGFSVFLAAVSMFAVKGFATAAIALGNWSISWGLKNEKQERIIPQPPVRQTNRLADAIVVTVPLTPAPPPAQAEAVQPAPVATELTYLERVAHACIRFWQSLWKAIAAGYQAAFVWVSGVGIYLLLRRDIDGAEMDEVYVEQEPEYGLPPLHDDVASGVPELAANRAAQPGDMGAQPSGGAS